ncbi:MAG: hypothetical protein ACLFVW_04095, partial [Phycisphaerae bacterium]
KIVVLFVGEDDPDKDGEAVSAIGAGNVAALSMQPDAARRSHNQNRATGFLQTALKLRGQAGQRAGRTAPLRMQTRCAIANLVEYNSVPENNYLAVMNYAPNGACMGGLYRHVGRYSTKHSP